MAAERANVPLMRLPWDSQAEVAVAAGCLYLPLLFDPAVARDLENATGQAPGRNPWVLTYSGRHFVRSLDLASFLDNFQKILPQDYQDLRRDCRKRAGTSEDIPGSPLDPRLAVILFEVLPHFVKRSPEPGRPRLSRDGVLELIRGRVAIPPEYRARAAGFGQEDDWRQALDALADQAAPSPPPPEGLVPAATLSRWFHDSLAASIAAAEKTRLADALVERRRLAHQEPDNLALLLYLADRGALELDGFGFSRLKGKKGEYRVYRRTGEYALKDFYGRVYFFPDCRVAVSTLGRLRPVVVEPYKHPLLRRFGPGQAICLPQEFQPSLAFTGEGVIQSLEAGLNALFYGYNARRRNGYHSLDQLRPDRTVDFDDYRLPPDHPKLASGTVEVKNIFM